MADVWGRLSGNAGVCLATLGPGATNLMTGVADANLDKAPLVAITAQGNLDRLHHESHQYIDIKQTFEGITKWNDTIKSPETVTEVIRKAFKIAESEKPGATHIELPEDIAAMEKPSSATPLKQVSTKRPGPHPEVLQQAVEHLKNAQRPLIIAGNGAIRKRASHELAHFSQMFRIPCVSTFMGKGAISDKSDLSLMAIGLGFDDYVLEAVQKADLILTIGYDIAEYAPQSWNPNGTLPIIHIDFEPAEVYEHYEVEVEVIADISLVLQSLSQHLAKHRKHYDTAWFEPVRQRILDDIAGYAPIEGVLNVPSALNILRDIMQDDGLLISDVGSHKMWIGRNFLTYYPNGCLISNGLASMGIALPGGVAASLHEPERQIVTAMGDGGFLMNVQELETAKRVGARSINIVFNDNDFGLIKWKQEMSAGKSAFTELQNPDIPLLAKSFGIKGYRATDAGSLREILTQSLEKQELCVIEVPIETSVNNQLIEKLDNFWNKKA